MIHYSHNIENAKRLRKNMTPWERKLWYLFLKDYTFRFQRQKCIGDFIVDFYCHKAKLVVELDGSQHYEDTNHLQDENRTLFLQSMGLEVIRIPNNQIDKNFRGICDYIDRIVRSRL